MKENVKPKVLLINGFVYLPGEGGYKRTVYMFNMMWEMGYDITLLTSDFNHYAKKKRNILKFREDFPEYTDIEILSIPSYTKNVSIKRWYAVRVWAKKVEAWFKLHASEYDVVYSNMPGSELNLKLRKICDKHNVKLIIDIRDLRPEVFRVILKNETIYRILTFFMKKQADKAYASADELIAVSNEYLQRGLLVNKNVKNPKAVYIGAILDKFYSGIDKYSDMIEKKENEIWITYAGTLGTTYDLYTLLDAAKYMQDAAYDNVRFKILGQGPESDSLVKYSQVNNIHNVDFVGFVDYEKMAAYLSKSDMTVNSLKARASQSIINKVADYFAAGIPILNGSLCAEMKKIVTDYNVGINFEPENVESLTSAIIFIIDNPKISKQFGLNAKKLALEKFDRKTSYLDIIKTIDNIILYK